MAALIQVSIPKNRIYLGLDGYFDDQAAGRAADESIAGFRKLRPGFDVVTDISQFKPASPQAAEHILRAQRVLKELQAGRIVRVVGSNVLAKMQMQRTGTQAGLEAEYAATREEAERMLDQPRSA